MLLFSPTTPTIKHIEVELADSVPAERVWASRLNRTSVRLENIPFHSAYQYGDILAIDPTTLRTVALITRQYASCELRFDGPAIQAKAVWAALTPVFDADSPFHVEGTLAARVRIAFPLDLRAALSQALAATRQALLLHWGDGTATRLN